MSTPNSTLSANAFSKCAPAIGTNIKQCGSVTVCNAIAPQAGDLAAMYQSSGDFRVMEALFHHDFEIKMCEAVQNGLYDFFMANKVNVRKTMQTRRLPGHLLEIAPFVLARQYSPINNAYWEVANGQASGGNWAINAFSTTNIPADVRSFPVGLRVWIKGKSDGGSATNTQWTVISATLGGSGAHVALVLGHQNSGSYLASDKLANPTKGIMTRGTPNVSDFEKWCSEMPAYLNWKNVPFWYETTRTAMCKSSRYDKWRELVSSDNALYREFFDLDDIQKNKQLANDWQRRIVDQMFWGKALPNQDVNNYDSLDTISAFDISTDWSGAELGIDVTVPTNCVGKRANAVGIYEQMAQCGRVNDLQGAQLNLPALWVELYNMMRVRQGNGHPSPKTFDIFTDSITAKNINTAMLQYYNNESDGMARLNIDGNGYIANNKSKKANFGFSYRSYDLFWPQGVTINILTHDYFDDAITASNQVGYADTARVLWILDFTGIYPGILASNRVVHKTGDLKTMASLNPSFACVMAVDTAEQTLVSMSWTMIVECPMSNLILENFDNEVPEPSLNPGGIVYGGASLAGTTSTTSTPV